MTKFENNFDWPKVSVIVPAYNCEAYLQQTLNSIYSQNYPALEIIVVDDGSTDGTAAVAKQNIDKILFLQKSNAGPAAARNYAAKFATGKYIAFLDSDDFWVPDNLKKRVACLEESQKYSVVFGEFKRLTQNSDGTFPAFDNEFVDDNKVTVDEKHTGWIYHEMLFDSCVHIITSLIRRSLFEELGGFRENLPRGEDYDFWIRASRVSQFIKINNLIALYRIHNNSITSKPSNTDFYFHVVENAFKKYGLVGPDGKVVKKSFFMRHLGEICFSHGYLHYHKGNPSVGIKSFCNSIKYSPLRIKPYVYIMASFFKIMLNRKRDD